MPTVLRWRGYRFFWFSWDRLAEPPHIHIWKDGKECKIWLADLNVSFNRGYSDTELRTLVAKTAEEQNRFMEIWHVSADK